LKADKRFEHFAAFVMIRGERSESFDTHDVVVGDDDTTHGGGDTGIDAIAIIANGVLVTDLDELDELIERAGYLDITFIFVQCETSSRFEGGKIGTFGEGVVDFFRDTPKFTRNNKVTHAASIMQAIYDKSSKFRKGNPACKLFYVTTGKWTGDNTLQARLDVVQDDLRTTGRFRSIEFLPVGADGVQKRYQQSRHGRTADFLFIGKTTMPDVPDVSEAYFGFLPWSEFKKLIMDDTGVLIKRLFFDNVRDWQGYNDVNSGIKDTLASDKRQFVLMNNGVTIIAKTLRTVGNKFTIEDYQIVNGCQTSHVLFDQRDALDETVNIPIRLIGTKDEDVIKAIIKATNWQTAITEEQLFALDEFPKALELYFDSFPINHRVYFERRSRQYESAPIEKIRITTFDGMIKAFAGMFLNDPHRTTRNYKSLKARLGKDIFAKNHAKEPYYAAALGLYRLESAFRAKSLETKFKAARFQILLAIRIIVAGFDMPALTANKMQTYCEPIIQQLQNQPSSDVLVRDAATLIEQVAGSQFDSDTIRTEPFTAKVIEAAKREHTRRSGKAA
jgi:AIPR protein